MKYAMYVIRHSDFKAALGNDGFESKHPLVRAHCITTALGANEYKPEMFEFYSHVANIEADSLEDAFVVGNGMGGGSVEALEPHPSLSVGHILIDEAGEKYMVDMIGFQKI